MATLEKRALEQALNILKGLDARFWVKLPTGEEYGEKPAEPRKGRGYPTFPRGALKTHYIQFVEALMPGEKVEFSAGEYGKTLMNSLTAWASQTWGAGSYMTSFNKDSNVVTIMRTI